MALPNGPMEIVFSFDTTGSMCSCLDEVRGRVQDMVQRLQSDIPGIRIAIFAHGDYCDASRYITKYEDFTDDVAKLCNFAKNVESTGGGDSDECYELVLHEVRTELSWTHGSQRALVMIGDSNPHEPDYPQNKLKLNWRDEADELGKMGVRIYSVQCGGYSGSTEFYKSISDRTAGKHLKLNQFQNVFDFIMAVCYREKGADFLDSYEKEVRARSGPVHKDLHQLFGDLRDTDPTTSTKLATTKAVKTVTPKPLSKATSKSKSMALKGLKRKPLGAKGLDKTNLSKTLKAYSENNLRRLKRENVPQTNFMLKHLTWSPWMYAIGPNSPISATWRKRSGDGCGYRVPVIFSGKTKIPALYEVAVVPKHRVNKLVVFSKICKGFTSKSNWEKTLLGKKHLRGQLDAVVKQGCQVYVRRAVVNGGKVHDNVGAAMKRYDYAWKCAVSDRTCHRYVEKMSVEISDNSFSL